MIEDEPKSQVRRIELQLREQIAKEIESLCACDSEPDAVGLIVPCRHALHAAIARGQT